MAPLARHRHPAHRRPDEPGNTETGPRPEHDLGTVLDRRPAADLMQLDLGQIRQGQGQGFEIIEQMNHVEPRLAGERALRKRPRRVGELDRVLQQRRGHGDARMRHLLAHIVEIKAYGFREARMIGVAEAADGRDLKRDEIGHGEARVGAADIGDECARRDWARSTHRCCRYPLEPRW